ncbi:MAG: fatty acid--CoA ligase family protein [Pseudomonadota bacterium]
MSDMIDIFLDRFQAAADREAVVVGETAVTYNALLDEIEAWGGRLEAAGLPRGAVVMLKGDFSRDAIAALFALMRAAAIIIPLAPASREMEGEFAAEGRAQWILDAEAGAIEAAGGDGAHALYDQVRGESAPAIVLFSSGSSGRPKGVVHNAARLLEKFRAPGKDLKTLAFLLFDHIAGLDTLFYSLANASTLVLPTSRAPDDVCAMVAAYKVEVLPTAPSFLNLLLLSGAHERHDLSSLKIVTYGSEMMPQSVLERCAEALPHVRLIQKYGTSEVGAPPTQSRSNTSTWMKIGGEGYEWRERDGKFEIKAKTAMVGYLNAPSPFTEDGYFMTGDRIKVDGEYVRFLGRDSDIINVGGQKVFPSEVEDLVSELDCVAEVAVFGEPHAILGAAVVARVRPADPEMKPGELRATIRAHLQGRLEPYKIPQKYKFTDEALSTARGKQVRRSE